MLRAQANMSGICFRIATASSPSITYHLSTPIISSWPESNLTTGSRLPFPQISEISRSYNL
uniref:Putative ovule protein n=1 Tax=Solanum chacoense TaxID=4108 RepID=A0A0V0GK74_SOLCH